MGRVRFNPEVSIGNVMSAGMALLFCGGLMVRIGQMEKTVERHQAQVEELDRKMERVLVLVEERTRPAAAAVAGK